MNPKLLVRSALLASLPDRKRARLMDAARRLEYSSGEISLSNGRSSGALYLVLSGKIHLHRPDPDKLEIDLGTLEAGESFGGQALLGAKPLPTTVTAIEPGELLQITRPLLMKTLSGAKPETVAKVFSALFEQVSLTSQRELQATLHQQALGAQMEIERQRTLTQTVAAVAHELNTPLGIINTAVSVMARELALPVEMTTERAVEVSESLELIRRNVERAHALVQDFKAISVNQLRDQRETFDIVEALQQTIGLMLIPLKHRGIRVNLKDKLSPDQHQWNGYRGYLTQILINFLSNAERYAYPSNTGGPVDITVEPGSNGDIELSVRDYGRGIPKKNLPKVFNPFFTTGRSNGGTGLGLAIVQNLVVEALKGRVRVESVEGKGTAFFVSIPRVVPE